jgi:hypothetical protein
MVEGMLEGPPGLIAEIAASSVSYDLHDKFGACRRNGVQEYLIWRVSDRSIDWFELVGGDYRPMRTAADGVFRSQVPRSLAEWCGCDCRRCPAGIEYVATRAIIRVSCGVCQQDPFGPITRRELLWHSVRQKNKHES